MGSYVNQLQTYAPAMDDARVALNVSEIISKKSVENQTKEVYEKLFGCIDLTSLNTFDSNSDIAQFAEKVNRFEEAFPQMNNVAAICVFPNRVAMARQMLEVSDVKIAAVSGNFPISQTFTEIKVAESGLAVLDGADEVDVVISLGEFFAGELEEMAEELHEIRTSIRDARLKVIVETGILKTAENIRNASLLAMLAGADFVKTSTGKVAPAATLEAAYVMCQAIKDFHQKSGVMVGFKPAGGIITTNDAVNYYTLVKEVLGEPWLDRNYFRLGTSRLANNLLTSIADREVKFF